MLTDDLENQLSRFAYLIRIKEHAHLGNIKPAQRQVLNAVKQYGKPVSLSEIAHTVGAQISTISDTVDTLERKELLSRCTERNFDGRCRIVQLTAAGEECLQRTRGSLADVLAALRSEELQLLSDLLKAMTQALVVAQRRREDERIGRQIDHVQDPTIINPYTIHTQLRIAVRSGRPTEFIEWLQSKCANVFCEECAQIVCPYKDPKHFSVRCPSCIREKSDQR